MSKLIKKKRKILMLVTMFTLAIATSICGMIMVHAEFLQSNFGQSGPSLASKYGGSDYCSNSCSYSARYGLRLSLVDKDGNRISGTSNVDIWQTTTINWVAKNQTLWRPNRWVYLPPTYGNKNRQEAVKAGNDLIVGSYWGYVNSKTMQPKYPDDGNPVNTKIKSIQDIEALGGLTPDQKKRFEEENAVGIGKDLKPNTYRSDGEIQKSYNLLYAIKLAANEQYQNGQNVSFINEILKLLGYTPGGNAVGQAAKLGYYIQGEPIITYGNIGNRVQNYYFTGTITEAYIADNAINEEAATTGGYTGIYILPNDKRPTIFSDGVGQTNISGFIYANGSKIPGNGVGHLFTGDFAPPGISCEEALEWIHGHMGQYGGNYESEEYKAAIAKVVSGEFEYTDSSGETIKINGPYPTSQYIFLNPTNYMQRVDDPPTSQKRASCEIPEKLECTQVVNYINKYSGLAKDTDEYHNAIDRVEAGTFYYYASPKGDGVNKHYYIINGPQNKMYLRKEKYTDPDSPYDGYASCEEPGKLTCETAIAIINGETPSGLTGFAFNNDVSFPLNSQAYHDAVAQVVAGNFRYMDGNNHAWEIDTGYSYNMLDPTYYVLSQFGGKAACEDIPVPCGEPAEIEIDKECETGISYFHDSKQEKYWLVCESAYLKGDDPLLGIPYSSDNTGHDAVEEANDGVVGNKDYCELFCTETVETEFPISVRDVKAGQVFGWGLPGRGDDGTFGYVKITKHCSNQEYNEAKGEGYQYKKWNNDYYNNENSLLNNFLAAEVRRWSNNTVTSQSYTGRSCGCCGSFSCGKDGKSTCCYSCTLYKGIRTGYTKTYGGDSWMSGVTQSSTDKTSSGHCTASSAEAAVKYTDIATYQSAYLSAKSKEPELLKKIRQCTQNIQYVFKTTITLQFEEPLNGAMANPNTRHFTYNDLLNLDPEEDGNYKTGYNTDNVNKSTCTEKTVYSYNCTGSGQGAKCTKVTQKVLDCKQVTWDIEGEWKFVYPEEQFTWFSLKTDSTMMNKENKPSGIDDAYFYSIGFGLPTAFSLPSGVYNLSVSVSNLGDNAEMKEGQDYNTTDGHFAPLLETNKAGKLGFDYDGCTYEVNNDIFGYDCRYDENGRLIYDSPIYCDPTKNDDPNGDLTGLDLEYRLVSLIDMDDDMSKAFPGQSGSGRDRGSNWVSFQDWEIDGRTEVDIRTILQDGIYDSMAMYEIMLDVNAIQYIRRSNSEYFQAGIDPYTSYYKSDNTALKYLCKEGTNLTGVRYCGSEFLTELNTSGALNYPLMGSCLPDGMSTEERVDFVLANGCSAVDSEVPEQAKYSYPTWNWVR